MTVKRCGLPEDFIETKCKHGFHYGSCLHYVKDYQASNIKHVVICNTTLCPHIGKSYITRNTQVKRYTKW